MDKKIELKDLAYILMYITIIFFGITGVIIYLIFGDFKTPLFLFVNYLILFIFGIIYYNKDIKKAMKDILSYKKLAMYSMLVGIGSIAVSIVINYVLSIGETANQTTVNEVLLENPVMSFFTIVLLGPLVEEIIYRHIFLGKLSNMIPKGVAITFSVFMFSYIHTGFSIEILVYIPIAIGITIMYLKFNKNLIVSYIYHILWNLYTFIASYIFLSLKV